MIRGMLPWKKKNDTPERLGEDSHPIKSLHRRMNELFDGFFTDFGKPGWPDKGELSTLSPCFEVSETDAEFKVSAELPGMDEKDIDVTLEDNVLTIKGEKKEEHEDKNKDYHVSERSYGMFKRSFVLPDGLEPEKVSAKFKKGVLTLSMPKSEEVKSKKKKIDISSE